MPWNRRTLLKRLLGLTLISGATLLLKQRYWPDQLEPEERDTLQAFLETLLPSSPGNTPEPARLATSLQDKAGADAEYRYLIRAGCEWLNRSAQDRFRRPFAGLDPGQRDDVVTLAQAQSDGSEPKVFFLRLRQDIFNVYYALPESRAGNHLPGPPQPLGHPMYHLPPSRS